MQGRSYSMMLAALAMLSTSACSTIPNGSPNEESRLMAISRDCSLAAQRGDVDAIVAYWSDDAAVMMSGLPTFRGKDAIRSYVAESMKIPGFKISWEPLEAHVSASGDMGHILEVASGTSAKGGKRTFVRLSAL